MSHTSSFSYMALQSVEGSSRRDDSSPVFCILRRSPPRAHAYPLLLLRSSWTSSRPQFTPPSSSFMIQFSILHLHRYLLFFHSRNASEQSGSSSINNIHYTRVAYKSLIPLFVLILPSPFPSSAP